VDMRTTSSGRALYNWTGLSNRCSRALIACSVHSDASDPISFNGWRMVVIPGVETVAGRTSSNPTTEQSPGTFSPASVRPRTTPRAVRSSKASTAVKGWQEASIRWEI